MMATTRPWISLRATAEQQIRTIPMPIHKRINRVDKYLVEVGIDSRAMTIRVMKQIMTKDAPDTVASILVTVEKTAYYLLLVSSLLPPKI